MKRGETKDEYPGDPDVIVATLSNAVKEFLNLSASEQLQHIGKRLQEESPLRKAVGELVEVQRATEADEARKAEGLGTFPWSPSPLVNAQLTPAKLDHILAALHLQVLDIYLNEAVNPLGFSARPFLERHGVSAQDVRNSVTTALRVSFYGEDNRGRPKTFDTIVKRLEFLSLYNRFSIIIKSARAMKRKRTKDLKKTHPPRRAESMAIDDALEHFGIPLRHKKDLFDLNLHLETLTFKWIREHIGDENKKNIESTYKRTLRYARREWESHPDGERTVLIDYRRYESGITLSMTRDKDDKTDLNISFNGKLRH